MKNDSLGDRMKDYEMRFKSYLPRHSYSVIRIDGKAFHSYTKDCKKPYDLELMDDMDNTAKFLCEQIQGCKLAYIQSDEISLILEDFDTFDTDAWFDGQIQKITSVSASMATAKFNQLRMNRLMSPFGHDRLVISCEDYHPKGKSIGYKNNKLAFFDSRVFHLPDSEEVINYLIWREQDATRNSIQMVGQANFSHKNLQNKSCDDIQEMLWFEKNINWNDLPVGFKRGRCVIKEEYECEIPIEFKKEGMDKVLRHHWVIVEPPIFTQDRDWVWNYIPRK